LFSLENIDKENITITLNKTEKLEGKF